MKRVKWLIPVCFTLLGAGVQASDDLTYDQREETLQFIDEMVAKHQFDKAELSLLFSKAEKKQKIIEAISHPAERVLEWKDYRKIFLTDSRIAGGVEFYRTHQKALQAAEERFGVPAEIITAVIGVETLYGEHKGRYRVVDALSTLAFDYPPRGKFFRSELEQFLLLAREQGFDPLSLNGSYAGAMGFGQFISSSYRRFAIDFDGDNKADLLESRQDAIGSIANYLAKHGWTRGTDIVVRAQVEESNDAIKLPKTLKLNSDVGLIRKSGVSFQSSAQERDKARLLKLEGAKGREYWVALNNFYSITRYNHSDLYAMAVYQLGQAIRQAVEVESPPAEEAEVSS
ncbi:lytic murein transglycosylase B [Hahella sp. CCB-MM4]|uniref:lytic murein transglycosylase B n=1 Tax=Hahella sp. (strain CCB-MM4) TaxID=1926491 RepID=UPI000B9BBD9E|nr:lytic murein transglycosylase B [Hahella sp. CCB-MM4]OZG71949.1 lytic murein transglycosylase B [Hahella sp. CCB-MM4]